MKEGRGQRADVRPQNLSQTHCFKIVIIVDYIKVYTLETKKWL